MIRNKPKFKYCGLTIILSNPSRFDKISLLSAGGGVLVNSCLQPEFNTMQCDVRQLEDKSPFLVDTKCVLLLGEPAMHHYCLDTHNNTLNELRGSPLYTNNIPAIASYIPQEAADLKPYEQQYNTLSENYSGKEESDEDTDEDSIKRFSGTRHSNYAFWLKSDVRKCKRLLREGTIRWPTESEPSYKIYPSAEETINALEEKKDEYFYFDMETDWEDQNLLCFSFSFRSCPIVYSVPVLDYNYKPSYSALPNIIKALVRAIDRNIIVAHNGAAFDFFVLASKYGIPVRRCYDTMIAMRRCFPEIEISLGHCVSYWTHQRFHKDTDSQSYRTHEQLMSKLKYCAKDVFTMKLVHAATEQYARTIPGLQDSIDCAMQSIRPYLICSLQGIKYDESRVAKMCEENDKLMWQYNRIVETLIGEQGMRVARTAIKGKAKLLPGSNSQCANYFHEQMEYPVIFRSDKTGKPSVGKTVLYKLALKHDNPVITFINLYRQTQKETGTLRFTPWKDDDGKIVDYNKWNTKDE